MLISLLLAGCMTDIPPTYGTCHLELRLEPEAAAAGETVRAIASPLSEPYDTTLRVNGKPVPVLEVIQEVDCDSCSLLADTAAPFDCERDCPADACDSCDTCREVEQCGACGPCPPCEADCDLCMEMASFEVPAELVPGAVEVVLANQYGVSNAATLQVLPPVTTDTASSQDTNSTPTDTGSPADSSGTSEDETGSLDTGPDGDSSAPTSPEDTASSASGS